MPTWGRIAVAVLLAIVLAIARKIRQLYEKDADFVLQNCRLRRDFYRNKVVWVTGASSGIGEELCRQLSEHGAKIVMFARSKEKMMAIKESLENPDDARVVFMDMQDSDSVRAAADEAKSLFDRVDILINNAGLSMKSTLVDMSHEHGCKIMTVNFLNAVLLTKLVLPGMLKQGSGQIVNISSTGAKVSFVLGSYYYASKHAMEGLMKSLRLELVGTNVHISNVLPGPVRTMVSHNSLTSSGEAYGKGVGVIDNGLPVERCVELILAGSSHYLEEMWIVQGGRMLKFYLSQYWPTMYRRLLVRKTKKLMGRSAHLFSAEEDQE